MNLKIYNKIIGETEKKKSNFVFHRNNNIVLIKGELFFDVLKNLPPHLQQNKALCPLESLYTVFFHKPTESLVIANKGASLLSKSILSDRYFVVYHIGFLVYKPNQGIEIIDVGIAGNLQKSNFVVLRPESACSPSFIFGSQRCNCYDQWLLAQELACEYNAIEKPKLSPQKLEQFLISSFSLDENGFLNSKSNGQAFIMIHLSSQNGMGSGVIENSFIEDLTANAYIRHRGEYSAEQLHNMSMAGGFKAIGITPDPRILNDGFSYKIPGIILDYFNSPKTIVALTNNKEKLNALKNSGYDVQRLQFIARVNEGSQIETDDRRKEFGHLIPENIKISWKQEFLSIKKSIDFLSKNEKLSKPDYEYTKNLTYFLKHSNEDKIDARWFTKTLPFFSPEIENKIKNKQKIKWLDVGTGPGTKPLEIAKNIIQQFGAKIEFTAVEPSEEWIKIFKENLKSSKIQKDKFELKVLKTTWEKFVDNNKEAFDLITFFHSVYGIGIVNDIFPSLKKLKKVIALQGVACIVVESPNSDLHFIKEEIFPKLYGREPISSKTIENTLNSFGIKYLIDTNEAEQKFYVDDILKKNNPDRMEPLSFIAQTQPENYNRLIPSKIKEKIEKYLKGKIKKDNKGVFINTPDRFIWIKK